MNTEFPRRRSGRVQHFDTGRPIAPPATSVRETLRNATADAHAALDAAIMPLFSAGERGYAEFLLGSAIAVFPLERELERAGVIGQIPDWPERSRSAALQGDLDDFAISQVPTITPPAISGEAFLFGIVYVLEGSRLGAQWLAREAAKHASGRVRNSARYLNHGSGRRLWPGFLERLEASMSVRGDIEATITGARAAFQFFAAAHSAAAGKN
jgi:heme oxygenase